MTRKLLVHLDFGSTKHHVGTLIYSGNMNRHVFAYNKEFLSTGLEISPVTIPLSDRTYEAEYIEDFHGLHGVFADSLPDSWGMRVQDVEFEKIGILAPLPLDRLAFIGTYAMGALKYEPAREFEKGSEIVEYADVRKAVQQVIKGDIEDVAEELLRCGGSAGGARPKFLLDINTKNMRDIRYTTSAYSDEYVPVLMKVPVGNDDTWQRIEYIYGRMAENAGIVMPQTYLLRGKRSRLSYYAIERFDIRRNNERMHMHTFAGMINEPFSTHQHDYGALLRTTELITNDYTQVTEAYRRMAFNYLACNRDDHAKNFSFCMDKKGTWTLSPAYDIGFSKGRFNNNTMAINGKTMNPTVTDFRIMAGEFRISKWKDILGIVIDAVKSFPDHAKAAGMSASMIRRIDTPIRENIRRIEKGLNSREL